MIQIVIILTIIMIMIIITTITIMIIMIVLRLRPKDLSASSRPGLLPSRSPIAAALRRAQEKMHRIYYTLFYTVLFIELISLFVVYS